MNRDQECRRACARFSIRWHTVNHLLPGNAGFLINDLTLLLRSNDDQLITRPRSLSANYRVEASGFTPRYEFFMSLPSLFPGFDNRSYLPVCTIYILRYTSFSLDFSFSSICQIYIYISFFKFYSMQIL